MERAESGRADERRAVPPLKLRQVRQRAPAELLENTGQNLRIQLLAQLLPPPLLLNNPDDIETNCQKEDKNPALITPTKVLTKHLTKHKLPTVKGVTGHGRRRHHPGKLGHSLSMTVKRGDSAPRPTAPNS